MKELIISGKKYIKESPIFGVISVLVLVLSYGFYATHYSFQIDQLVGEYYNGTVLIGAGRWFSPLLHFLTASMNFAPFWHTVIMCICLWSGGFIWMLLLKKISDGKMSNSALGVFGILYMSYPLITAQLTFPIIHIALAFGVVGTVLYLLSPLFNGEKLSLCKISLSVILLTTAIDSYESFASVYFCGCAILLIVKYFYGASNLDLKKIVAIVAKITAIVIMAIGLDFAVSKLLCKAFCGTFDFWYSGSSLWGKLGLLECIIWLGRNLIANYFIVGFADFSIFLFVISIFTALVFGVVYAIKQKSIIPVLLFGFLILCTFSLAIVMGQSPHYRMAQPITVFVAFIGSFLVEKTSNKAIIRYPVLCVVAIACLNCTQTINNYSVQNYERHLYETEVLRTVATDLLIYSKDELPVVFISDERTLPKEIQLEQTNHPLGRTVKKLGVYICDNYLDGLIERVTPWYGDIHIENNEDFIDFIRRKNYHVNHTFLTWSSLNGHFVPDVYRAMEHMGSECIVCTDEQYLLAEQIAASMPAYPEEGYICETEEMIIVNLNR